MLGRCFFALLQIFNESLAKCLRLFSVLAIFGGYNKGTIKFRRKIIMNKTESKAIEEIKAQYLPQERTKLDDLKALDKKAKRPAQIFAYAFGAAGALVLGTGMCLAMKIIGSSMPLGIVIGVVGIAMASANYWLYKKILSRRKQKYAKQIMQLSSDLLHE